jgi:hypothetical protein
MRMIYHPVTFALALALAGCMLSDPDKDEGQDRSPFPKQQSCKWGFQDKDGKVVIAPRFDDVGDFHEALAYVRSGSKYGFVDFSGKLVIDTIFDDVTDMRNGYAGVVFNGKSGFIDPAGRFTPLPQGELRFYTADFSTLAFSGGLAVARLGSAYGYIDTKAGFVISPSYADAHPFFEEVAWVKHDNGFWNYIDKSGKSAIDPQFTDADDFHQGLAAVKVGSKWGYLEKPGRMAIQPLWDSVAGFSEGLAVVYRDGLAGFIDKSGREVINPHFQLARSMSDGLAAVKGSDGKWFYINAQGQAAFAGKYDWAGSFRGGYALKAIIYTDSGTVHFSYGLIDKAGNNLGSQNNTIETCEGTDEGAGGGAGNPAYIGSWGANHATLNSAKTDSIHLVSRWTFTATTFVYNLDLDYQGSLYPVSRQSGSWTPAASGASLVPTHCTQADSTLTNQVAYACPESVNLYGLPSGDRWTLSMGTYTYTLRKNFTPSPVTRKPPAEFSLIGNWYEAHYEEEDGRQVRFDAALGIEASAFNLTITMIDGATTQVITKSSGTWATGGSEIELDFLHCSELDDDLGTLRTHDCPSAVMLDIDKITGTLHAYEDSTDYVFHKL